LENKKDDNNKREKESCGLQIRSKVSAYIPRNPETRKEGICVQNLRMLASTRYVHRHQPPLYCAWHRVVLVRGAMEATAIDDKTTTV